MKRRALYEKKISGTLQHDTIPLVCLFITSFADQKAGESKTYTVDDINNGFTNYSNNSTNLKTRGSSANSNVVGTVFDDDTGVIIEKCFYRD